MVILNGSRGIGKETHAKNFCSYFTKKKENNIFIWIESDSENKVQKRLKEIIEEIKNIRIEYLDRFDRMCHDLARLVEMS